VEGRQAGLPDTFKVFGEGRVCGGVIPVHAQGALEEMLAQAVLTHGEEMLSGFREQPGILRVGGDLLAHKDVEMLGLIADLVVPPQVIRGLRRVAQPRVTVRQGEMDVSVERESLVGAGEPVLGLLRVLLLQLEFAQLEQVPEVLGIHAEGGPETLAGALRAVLKYVALT
jgi:hypothetical protein